MTVDGISGLAGGVWTSQYRNMKRPAETELKALPEGVLTSEEQTFFQDAQPSLSKQFLNQQTGVFGSEDFIKMRLALS